ncbi:MAG TPA: hypothetical protein VFM15_09530 [Gammaproteobacteria bacterium]|nr:hypothetical protein [Gammaproteobacteria bacterium]
MQRIHLSAQLDTRRWLPWCALLFAMLLCAVLYAPGLKGPMLFDDFPQLGRFFHQPAGQTLPLSEVWWGNSGPLGRPVAMLSFWLNSVLTPDNLPAWKLTNLVIHLLCGLFAGLLAMELFAAVRRERGVEPRYLGALVGMIWLLHPLQVSTVLYTVQRMTELAALFSFVGLYGYVLARRYPTATANITAAGLVGLGVATGLAAFSKENGLLLPFLALAIELAVFHGAGTRGTARLVKAYFIALCVLVLTGGVVLLLLRPHFITGGYAFRDFTFGERLLSEPRILFDYLYMLLAPFPGNMGFFHDDFLLSAGLLHPVGTLAALVGLFVLVLSAWFARRTLPLYALGVAFFLIGQSMESSVIALRPMFEHRNYLPDFGVFLALTDLLAWGLMKRGNRSRLTLAGAVLAGLAILLGVRVAHWSSGLNFYAAAARAHPHSEAAAAGLAQEFIDRGRPQQALQALAGGNSFGVQLQRAWIECRLHGELPDATLEALLHEPTGHLDTYPVTGLTLLGIAGIRSQCKFSDRLYSQLIDRTAGTVSTKPSLRYMLYLYSAYYHRRLQQLPLAMTALQNAHRMSPTIPVPVILSARWYLEAGDVAQARSSLQRAADINRRQHAGFDGDIAALEARLGGAPATRATRPH